MIPNFFQQQMDYVFYVYGLAFVILGVVALLLHQSRRDTVPWSWLAVFGFLHGFNEWLDCLTLSLGDSPAFSAARLVIMVASFMALLEFGRDGFRRLTGKGPQRWIYLPLLVGVGLGSLAGVSGMNPAARYLLGLLGGFGLRGYYTCYPKRKTPVFSLSPPWRWPATPLPRVLSFPKQRTFRLRF